jgi:endonuclease III
MEIDCGFLNIMQDYLEKNGKLIEPAQAALDIKDHKKLSFETHIKYMIHSQLSNQDKWANVKEIIKKIDAVFFNYDIKEIKSKDWEYFYEKIRNIKPHIRGVSLKGQMKNLHANITIMEKIDNDNKNNGGLDSYVTSKPPKEIIKSFVGENKLSYMGVSLVCEYLKNVGVECVKPDTHIMRFLSRTRRGFLNKNEAYISKKEELKETIWNDNDKFEAIDIIEKMEKISSKKASDIDRIIWSYCAKEYGDICSKTPKCNKCLIRNGCNHDKKLGDQF